MSKLSDMLMAPPDQFGFSKLVESELQDDWDVYEQIFGELSYRAPVIARTADSPLGWWRYAMAAVLRELTVTPTAACPRCKGEQEIVAAGSGSGFAGGHVYWTELACGHVDMDESDDIRAAR